MCDKESKQKLSERLASLEERRVEFERRIADCERYLEITRNFTSSEEQLRAAFDIEAYQEELLRLQGEIELLKNQLGFF